MFPVTPSVLDAARAPETVSAALTVEDAAEMNPALVRKSPATEEDAPAANPPEASSVNTDEDAVSCTMRADPVWAVKTFKVRFVAVVDVAAIVATEFTSGLEVPTPKLSVMVVR